MPIVERNDDVIIQAVTDVLGREVKSVQQSEGGLDNSVYFIYLQEGEVPQYVLKIVESKSDELMRNAINFSNLLTDFTKLEFCEINGNYLHSSEHLDKKFVIMNFLPGRHPDISNDEDALAVARFASRLHSSMPRIRISPKELLQQEVGLIFQYHSNHMIINMERVEGAQGSWYKERAALYKQGHAILKYLLKTKCSKFDDESCYITRGITHGDMNSGNLIIDADKHLSFIDPDAIDRNGFQITDVLHAAAKSGIVQSEEKINKFINHYLEAQRDCKIDMDMTHTLLFCLSFKASLSTDYYTKFVGDIPKISTEWVYINAKDTLDELSNAMASSAKALGMSVKRGEISAAKKQR